MSSPGSRPVPPAASQLNLRGAVDLSSLRRPAPPAPAPRRPEASNGAANGAGDEAGASRAQGPSLRVDATEANFQDLVGLSAQVPVVFVLWATYSPESAGLLDTMEDVVTGYGGSLVMAAADIEAFPQLAQAFQVQAVPTAVAVVKGQPVPLFQGSAGEAEIRSLMDELLKVAAANGVTGNVGGAASAETAPAPLPPHHQAAFDAIEAGDYAAAAAAYRKALAEMPSDAEAKAGLAQVELMQRMEKLSAPDAEALRQKAADEPDDLDAQLAVADLDVSGGHIEDAFNRIISFIGRNPGPERERARIRLLELFDVVGTSDPRVSKARQGLARILF